MVLRKELPLVYGVRGTCFDEQQEFVCIQFQFADEKLLVHSTFYIAVQNTQYSDQYVIPAHQAY